MRIQNFKKKNMIANVLVMSGRGISYDLPEAVRFSSYEQMSEYCDSWIMVEYIRTELRANT